MTKTLTPALSQREREQRKSPLHSLSIREGSPLHPLSLSETLPLHPLSLWERVRVRAAP